MALPWKIHVSSRRDGHTKPGELKAVDGELGFSWKQYFIFYIPPDVRDLSQVPRNILNALGYANVNNKSWALSWPSQFIIPHEDNSES